MLRNVHKELKLREIERAPKLVIHLHRLTACSSYALYAGEPQCVLRSSSKSEVQHIKDSLGRQTPQDFSAAHSGTYALYGA